MYVLYPGGCLTSKGTCSKIYGDFIMTGYELYVFIICMITLFSTFCLLSAMLMIIVHQEGKAIGFGMQDDEIIIEYAKGSGRPKVFEGRVRKLFFILIILVMAVFAWTFYVRFSSPMAEGDIPTPRVVLSDSMSYKNKSNEYLTRHGLDDQFDTFDIIMTHELPGEFELEVYDVVVYEINGELIVHRIIDIEEPNEKHPDTRLFRLQGDALKYSDQQAVEYSQMRAIYRGEKIQYIGSFVLFMQSPAGYICIMLILFGFFATPIIERGLRKKKKERLIELGVFRTLK